MNRMNRMSTIEFKVACYCTACNKLVPLELDYTLEVDDPLRLSPCCDAVVVFIVGDTVKVKQPPHRVSKRAKV